MPLLFKEGTFPTGHAERNELGIACYSTFWELVERASFFSFCKIIYSSFCYVFLSLNIALHSGEHGLEWNHNKLIRIYIFPYKDISTATAQKYHALNYVLLSYSYTLYSWFFTSYKSFCFRIHEALGIKEIHSSQYSPALPKE